MTLRQPRVEPRRSGPHVVADVLRDVLHRREQLLFVGEHDVGLADEAVLLDEHLVDAVDHDLPDRLVAEQRVDRLEEVAQRRIEDLAGYRAHGTAFFTTSIGMIAVAASVC